MVRRFKILDEYNNDSEMGELQYNTETKQFRVFVLNDYTGKYPDTYMQKYSKLGITELPADSVARWINQRILPPNRHAINWILKEAGIPEYDEMAIMTRVNGRCARDNFYFKEII